MEQEKNKAFRYTFYYGSSIVAFLGLIIIGAALFTFHIMKGNENISIETSHIQK
jgi:plastocyanin domain-containing protein